MTQVTKYDRNGYKPRARIVVITDKSFYLLDGKNYKLKLHVTLDKIKGKLNAEKLSILLAFSYH